MRVCYRHQEENELECKSRWIDICQIDVKQQPNILISYFCGKLMHPNIIFSQR
jgi:hypothetical protein